MTTWRSRGQTDPSGLAGDNKGRYFLAYTLVFCAVFFFSFIWYILPGRTFIYKGDGWNQHYRALVYYGQYLRDIIRGLLKDGRLVIPHWSFSIGEGADIIHTLHYYVVGDPLALLSAFVPAKYTHYLYDLLVFLRLYLAGGGVFHFFASSIRSKTNMGSWQAPYPTHFAIGGY